MHNEQFQLFCAMPSPACSPQSSQLWREGLPSRPAGFLGSFTAAAVVDAPPDRVFRILSSPAEFPSVYSACVVSNYIQH